MALPDGVMTLTFNAVRLADKIAIIWFCARLLFYGKATLIIPNSMVRHASNLEPMDNNP